jgi:hypothetical protein
MDVAMKPTVTLEIPADCELLVRRMLSLHEELTQLALDAPDGSVFDACETAIVAKGRDLNARILQDVVAQRVTAAEKKGRRCGPAPVVVPRKIAGPKTGNSSVRSVSSP